MPTVYKAQDHSPRPKPRQAQRASLDRSAPRRKHLRPFSWFARQPDRLRFETQEKEETVELFLRQHPVVIIPWAIGTALLLVAPFTFLPMFFANVQLPFHLPVQYVIVGTGIWYLFAFGFFLSNLIHWFFNIYIVTNERIVDIDFMYLLYKKFSVAELDKIQDLTYTTSGVLSVVFNYGNVYVQTAGDTPNIEFHAVPQPQKVVEAIRALAEERTGAS